MRQRRAQIVEQMHDLTKNSGAWNALSASGRFEAQERWANLDREQKNLSAEIARAEMDTVITPPLPELNSNNPLSQHEHALAGPMRRFQEDLSSSEYRSAFGSWLRRGSEGISRSERDTLSDITAEVRTYAPLSESGGGPAGDYLVPIGFQREIEEVMKAYGGMRRNARIVPTSTGNPLYWPSVDDTANMGRWLSETSAVSQTNPTFGNIEYNAYLASSDQVLISVQLLQDSAFDAEALLTHLVGIRLGRLTDAGYTTGTGTTQPTGIIYSIQNDGTPLTVTASGSSANDGVSTNTGSNSIGSDDLDSIIALVDPSYRPGAKFLAHWSVLDYLKKVKDKYGRPLFTVSVAEGQPDKIFGYPYDWSGAMQATTGGVPTSGQPSVLFGNFDKYIIRDVLGMTMVRYNELYMPNHEIGFQAYLRTDGIRLQQKAFSLLVQHS